MTMMKKPQKVEGLICCLKTHSRTASMDELYYDQERESSNLTLDKHSVENLTLKQVVLNDTSQSFHLK